ncbi:MAG: DUF748 domain-containing protein, partial [Gammaproteobacteria bacterium]
VDIHALTWAGEATVPQKADSAIDVRGTLGLQRITMNLPETADAQIQALTWDGTVGLLRSADPSVKVEGELTLSNIDASTAEEIKVREQQIQWRGQGEWLAGALSLAGRLSLEQSAINRPDLALKLEGMNWEGTVKGIGSDDQSIISRSITLKAANYQALGEPLELSATNANWQGELNVNIKAEAEPRLNMDGDFNLGVSTLKQDNQQARLSSLEINELKGDSQTQIALRQMSLSGISVEDATKENMGASPLLTLDSARFIGASYRPDGQSHIDRLVLRGNQLRLVRNEQGAMVLPVPGTQKTENDQPDATKPTEANDSPEANSALNWSVGAIVLEGDNRWEFQDLGHDKPVSLVLAPISLTTGAIDTAARDQATDVQFKAGFGDDGSIELAGTVKPLANNPAADIKGSFQHLNLLDISRYLEEAIDHRVTSGNLDASSEFKLVDGKIQATNSLSLFQFEVESNAAKDQQQSAAPASDQAGATGKEEGKTSLPLGLALSLLRDSENRIQLDLPIEGDLDNPQFDPSDAIGQAVSSAVSTGALLFLQPFGTLAIAGKLALSNAALVRFEPAEFSAGGSELSGKQNEYLSALAGKLKQRPGLRIKVCGRATSADAEALKPAPIPKEQADKLRAEGKPVPEPKASDDVLEKLAEDRATAVRKQLREIEGIEAAQLVSCAARVDRTDSATPRVELGM